MTSLAWNYALISLRFHGWGIPLRILATGGIDHLQGTNHQSATVLELFSAILLIRRHLLISAAFYNLAYKGKDENYAASVDEYFVL